jgi:hypothetical protein
MSPLQVLLVATATWIAWVPAAGLQRAARGRKGGVSIVPVLPFFPLAAWGLAWWLQRSGMASAPAWLGVAHLALLVLMLASIVKSKRVLRRRRETASADGSERAPQRDAASMVNKE